MRVETMGKTTKKNVGAIVHSDHVSFRVWAPFAVAVAVTGVFNNWGKSPMQNEGDGYWFVENKEAEAGQEYKYVISTSQYELYRNDPRALQVVVDAGNSLIVDRRFEWEDDGFVPVPLNQQVLYEVHVGTFNRIDAATQGTFETVADKLDYLVDLGVTTVELMPIGSMPNDRGWGYAPDYIYAIESLYGGHHGFMEFVNAAHKKGISVVLDVVYNHLGVGAGTFDMWQYDGWSQDGGGGIYFYNDWRNFTPWGLSRYDYGRPEVRQFILDNVRMWMQECHLDGLRVDATSFMRNVYGNNDDPAHDIPEAWLLLQDINTLSRKINPQALIIAEDIGWNNYITKPTSEGGAGFSAQWEVWLPNAFRAVLKGTDDAWRQLPELANALSHGYNGDVFQRVVYSDSHDSAANGGARLNEQIAPGHADSLYARRRSLLASSVILTAPGIPMLLQGEEFMQGGSFNDWQALDWERAEKLSGMVLAHKHLIALRKNQYGNTRGLTGQSFTILHLNEESKVLAYHRWDQGGAGDDVVVVFNFANRTQKDYIINFPRPGHWAIRFNSDWKGYSLDFKEVPSPEPDVESGSAAVTLAPYSVLILSQEP